MKKLLASLGIAAVLAFGAFIGKGVVSPVTVGACNLNGYDRNTTVHTAFYDYYNGQNGDLVYNEIWMQRDTCGNKQIVSETWLSNGTTSDTVYAYAKLTGAFSGSSCASAYGPYHASAAGNSVAIIVTPWEYYGSCGAHGNSTSSSDYTLVPPGVQRGYIYAQQSW